MRFDSFSDRKILTKFGLEEEIEFESKNILVRNKISTEDFSAAALASLPPNASKWEIPSASCVHWLDLVFVYCLSMDCWTTGGSHEEKGLQKKLCCLD